MLSPLTSRPVQRLSYIGKRRSCIHGVSAGRLPYPGGRPCAVY